MIATPDFSGVDHHLWHVLLLAGCALLAWEWYRGWRQEVFYGPCGLVFVVLCLALLPAWLRGAQPSSAMGFALAYAGQLVFAGYCMQVIAPRVHLALAAVLAAVTVQAGLAMGQYFWVLPELLRQLEAGRLSDVVTHDASHDMAERLRNGGSYGSFTLANGLAIVLAAGLALAVSLCHNLWRQGHPARWPSLLLPLWLTAGLILADTKGSWAALAAATLWVSLSLCRPRWRWTAIGVFGGALISLALFVPLLEIPSIAVRVGYHLAATQLWLESPWWGHGWEAFAYQGAQHLPVWAEFARRVHNEVLESLVAGGLLAALPLIALMIMLAWPSRGQSLRHQATERTPASQPHTPWWMAVVPLGLIPLGVALGTLQSDNLAYWPGAAQGMMLLWGLLWGACAGMVFWLATRCTSSLPKGSWVAVLVLLLGSLIDFHLHEMAVVTLLIVLSCCHSSFASIDLSTPRRQHLAAGSMLTMVILASFLVQNGQQRSEELAHAQRIVSLLTSDHQDEATAQLQTLLGAPDGAADPQTVRQQGRAVASHLAGRFPAHEALLAAAASSHRDPHARIRALEDHLQRFTPRTGVLSDLAASHAQAGAWEAAIHHQQQAIALNPWFLPLRQQLISYYRAAQHSRSSDHEALAAAIAQEEARIRELTPQVFSRNRIRPSAVQQESTQ
ncbi:MAG: O-antigen ligase domain-containing protein [Planctomycetota bacterium]|nr:MAG: O-antigen ligase domain-containing protein [Planctomycetota bacterium]